MNPSDVLVGDVLMFRGCSDTAEAIRIVDGGRYDHAALVVGLDPEIMMVEVNFMHGERKPLREYGEAVEEVAVRRHRIGGGQELVAARGIELASNTPGYAFDRLLSIALSSVTRFSNPLLAVDVETARRFHGQVLVLAKFVTANPPAQNQRSCIELVNEAHDVPAIVDDHSPSPYYGLVLPLTKSDGLLDWVISEASFEDFFFRGPSQGRPNSFDETVDRRRLRELTRAFWIAFGPPGPPGSPAPDLDFQDEELRDLVVKATAGLFERINIPIPPKYHELFRPPRQCCWINCFDIE
jgi:hypothetical protein